MPLGKRGKKWRWFLALTGAGIVLLWFGLPLWFPWVLNPGARLFGARYARYERVGYSRFVVHNLSYEDRSARVTAERVEAFVPTIWLWRLRDGTNGEPFVRISGWRFQDKPSNKPPTPTFSKVQKTSRTVGVLQRWIPEADLTNGTVQSGQTVVTLSTVNWSAERVAGYVELPGLKPEQRLFVQVTRTQAVAIHIKSEALHLGTAALITTNSAGLDVKGSSLWWSNQVAWEAHFGVRDVPPETARLRVEHFQVPAEVTRLPEYQQVEGTLSAEWAQGQFTVDITGGAQPVAAEADLPPLTLALHVAGDTNSATVQTAKLTSAWLEAQLSQELTVYAHGQLLRSPVALRLRADLAKVPWMHLEGNLAGEADFVPTAEKLPAVQFHFSGMQAGLPSLRAEQLRLEGVLEWPRVEITRSRATFADGSTLSVAGSLQITNPTVTGGRLSFRGPLAQRWLPAGYGYQDLLVSGTFHGPVKALDHSGHLAATNVSTPFLQPARLEGDWHGKQLNFVEGWLIASVGQASLDIRGLLTNETERVEAHLESLTLTTNGQPALELARPCAISMTRGAQWEIRATPIQWLGIGGEVNAHGSVEWPTRGDLELKLKGLSSVIPDMVLKNPLPPIRVSRLTAEVGWSNGPVTFAVDLSAAGRIPRDLKQPLHWEGPGLIPVTADLNMRADQTGIVLSNLTVTSSNAPVTRAHGIAAVSYTPGKARDSIHIEGDKPLQIDASVDPEAFLWKQVAEWTGVRLENPRFHAQVSGTWQAPRGEISLEAKKIDLSAVRKAIPSVDELHLLLQLERDQARLSEGQFSIRGQEIKVTGQIPLGQKYWKEVRGKPVPDWDEARGRLEIEEADLAALEPLLPKLIAPQGELSADIALLPGTKFEGHLKLRGALTRPIGNLGPIRDINLQMRVEGRTVKLDSATAKIGPAPVTIAGQVDLTGTNWLKGELPPFQITINGKDVPLARQPEFIIRSDLELAITRTNGASPLISGLAHLRDSYYLSDFSALMPGKVATPSRRPPYFSITEEPLAGWRLAVNVDGLRFLKVRSPLFTGESSANLKLLGTLKEPLVLGDLRADSGLVRFPFANFQVHQGLVTLTSEDPYHPQLLVSASSKQYGYELQLQVNGPIDEPVIQFSSTPPLSSEQILLMVTAGQMPHGAFTLTPQQRAQTVALFLGRDVLAKMGFGDQTEERLTIRSGEQVSEQGRPTYNVEYKLAPDWSLVGERDRFGDYNAGLKWRIYSK